MRIIILLLVLGIMMYLITSQIEEVTPTEEAGASYTEEAQNSPTEDTSGKGMYSKELNKARSIEQGLQDQLDKRMEEADRLAE